jgi:ferrous iron transport protein B
MAEESAAEGAAIVLLSEDHQVNGHLPGPVIEALRAATGRLEKNGPGEIATKLTVARYAWLEELVNQSLQRAERSDLSRSDRLDRILTHKIWGLAAFAGMMAVLFYSIFVLAAPLMGLIESGVDVCQQLASRLLPPGPLLDLIRNGVIAGVGNVVTFFPQICILFLFIAVLEDTGYMARAAFLMDRIMNRVGLHGKSFIPLLSCHACAIPGIMATRTIESSKDRLATILVAPLMSCSARLPVYTVLIAACLPGSAWIKAGVMLCMYSLGIVAALTMATLFKKTLLRGPTPAFILELPPYRIPRPFSVLRVMWDRSKLFLTRAGTTILAITVVLWVLMNYPGSASRAAQYDAKRQAITGLSEPEARARVETINQEEAAETLQNSLAGKLGRTIEPVIRPLGFDWKIGIGLIASFAAREVFVSTMGVIYSVGAANEESTPLRRQLATATWPDGRKVYTPLVAISLMVFYVLACQCVSTIAVVHRETNSWRWPIFMFGYMTVLAYVGSFLVYQIGSRF